MSNKSDIDYKNTHFEHPELTRIHGVPTTADLITLQREVRANCSTVHTTLGGGHNGHLGLACHPQTYTNVPNSAPYVRPPAPPPLNVQPGATQFQIQQARDEHSERARLFREVLAVERTIVQQIIAALDAKFLKALRDPITNKITRSIPDILTYLFNAYGYVTPTELYELKNKVETMQFSANEPVDTLTTEIDDLADIADLAESPISDRQRVDMGYLVLQRCRPFKTGLKEWNDRPNNDKTWANFKTHFRDAQIALRRTGDITMEQGLNHTELLNMVEQGVRAALADQESPPPLEETNQLKQQVNEMRTIIERLQMANSTQQQPATFPQPTQQIPPPAPLQQNQQYMQQPLYPFQQYTTPPFAPFYNYQSYDLRGGRGYGRGGGRGGGRGRGRGRGGRGSQPRERKYCWTHGLCNHNGRECNHPAQGHQPDATLENRMGGNNYNVHHST